MRRALILPGLDGSGELLDGLVAHLAPEISASAMAYPSESAMGHTALIDFVAAALPEGNFVLIAESFSGPIAIEIASRFPARVDALILCATFVSSPHPGLRPLHHLLRLPLPSPPAAFVARVGMGRWSSGEWVIRLRRAMRRLGPGVARNRLAAVVEVDASSALKTLRCPILYLQARYDRLVHRAASARIIALAPHTRVTAIEGPHFLLQARPEAVAESIKAFLG